MGIFSLRYFDSDIDHYLDFVIARKDLKEIMKKTIFAIGVPVLLSCLFGCNPGSNTSNPINPNDMNENYQDQRERDRYRERREERMIERNARPAHPNLGG